MKTPGIAKETAVLKVQDETTESALCVGIVAALIWGIGLSWYGFHQGPGEMSWTVWGAQLIGGIVSCILVPLAFVWGRDWVLARIQPASEPLRQQS